MPVFGADAPGRIVLKMQDPGADIRMSFHRSVPRGTLGRWLKPVFWAGKPEVFHVERFPSAGNVRRWNGLGWLAL